MEEGQERECSIHLEYSLSIIIALRGRSPCRGAGAGGCSHWRLQGVGVSRIWVVLEN